MSTLNQILSYLISTVLDLYLLAVLLRLLLQLTRADFYNPISQFLVKITSPLVIPLRRVIPAIGRLDTATVVLLLLLQIIGLLALIFLRTGTLPSIIGISLASVFEILALVLNFYFFAVLIIIVLSFVAPGTRHPAALLLHQLVDPVMRPFRKVLPSAGGLDFSPLLLFATMKISSIILVNMAAAIGWRVSVVF
jgi:YggT family protein